MTDEELPGPTAMGRRRRFRWGLVAGVAVLGAVAVLLVTWFAFFRDTATPIEPGDVTTDRDADLYLYETTGFEEVDALGGSRHDYAAESVIAVRDGGCGRIVRWRPLAERWFEEEICTGAGAPTLRANRDFHRWFGVGDTVEYVCTPPARLVPEGETAWTYECSSENTTIRYDAEVVARETLTVAGANVDTVHIRIAQELSGSSRGTAVRDVWRVPETGLIVREIWTDDSINDSALGDVTYTERFEIRLKSLDPLS